MKKLNLLKKQANTQSAKKYILDMAQKINKSMEQDKKKQVKQRIARGSPDPYNTGTKINYVIGRYREDDSGQQESISDYCIHGSTVHYGTMEDAKQCLEYVAESDDEKGWQIFTLSYKEIIMTNSLSTTDIILAIVMALMAGAIIVGFVIFVMDKMKPIKTKNSPQREAFLKYYDRVMPTIKKQIEEECGKKMQEIYAKYNLSFSPTAYGANISIIDASKLELEFHDTKPVPSCSDAFLSPIDTFMIKGRGK